MTFKTANQILEDSRKDGSQIRPSQLREVAEFYLRKFSVATVALEDVQKDALGYKPSAYNISEITRIALEEINKET